MKDLFKKAKEFINLLVLTLTKVETVENNYDPKIFSHFNVTIVNPLNGRYLLCNTVIANVAVSEDAKVKLYVKYKVLMEILIDYIYHINDNSYVRDQLPDVFNIEEIKLLFKYFYHFQSFRDNLNGLQRVKVVRVVC